MEDKVTNKQLYDLVDTKFDKLSDKIDNLVDTRIVPLERSMDKIWIYGGMFATAIGIGVNIVWGWSKTHVLRIS